MTPEEYGRLPRAEVVIEDPSPFEEGFKGKPYAWVEVDGVRVARLPITGARLDVAVNAGSTLHLTLIAGRSDIRSRQQGNALSGPVSEPRRPSLPHDA